MGRDSIEATFPTCTPRISTLAFGFITRPALDEITVTGMLSVKLPWNKPTATATIAAITATVTRPVSARIPACSIESFPYPERLKFPLEP